MGKKSIFSPFVKQSYVTAAVCCNIIGHGCMLGFPGVLLPQLHQPDSPIILSKEMESWIASVLAISMFFSNFLTPPIMGRLGRKAAHYAVTLPVMVGWIVMILATSSEALLIGRILHGMSMGMMLPLRSVLIGEYTSPHNRGGFLTTIALAQCFGILFVHLVGSILSFQLTALISLFFSFISILMTIYSPESPSWLATQGQYDKCRKVFIWLRGEEEIPELDKMIEASKQMDEQPKQGLKEIVSIAKKKEVYKPIILMIALYIMLNFTGGTMFAAYSTRILHLLMGPDINAHVWMVALDTQRLFFNIGAVYVINKTGRRTMLFATGALCAGSHLAQAAYIFAKTNDFLPFDSIWIPGILVNLQVLSVAVGMVPLPSVIAGEVFPLQYRSLAGSTSLIAISIATFLALKTFPGLVSSVGLEGTYVLYAGIITSALVVAWFLLPETKGKTLQQIEEHFRGECDTENDKEVEKLNGSEKKNVLP
ncbi:sugar transporter ERD6-like 1 [Leguminivora glycinivorella]|uniref:sugar transporter ERD6-like 1 n=1 Tax=Leguminivora glycinivorella TaxID=1035111 RepID=UPI00201059C9|nr:sugar transporter ERD6-like 1 [Leguminivora glycinivorella]